MELVGKKISLKRGNRSDAEIGALRGEGKEEEKKRNG